MTRLKASALHFIISLTVICVFFLLVYFIWYDSIFVEISGVIIPARLMVIIDVLLGPFLTFMVYKKGKKSLKFDLAIIALLQMIAFVYGAYTLYLGKPSLVVMKKDAFEVVIQKHVDYKALSSDMRGHIFSQPKYALINPDKLSLFKMAYTQQEHFLSLQFSNELVLKKRIPFERVLVLLMKNSKYLANSIGVENLESNYYLINDNDEYAILVVNSENKPIKILRLEKNTTP